MNPEGILCGLFLSDYLQVIPKNTHLDSIQMGKNVINILEHLVVMTVELSSMTQFCVMFLESILKSAYQDQTSEACQYIAGMLVSIADGLYSTPHFPRYKAGFQFLPICYSIPPLLIELLYLF